MNEVTNGERKTGEDESYLVVDARQSAYTVHREDRFDDAREAMEEADNRGQGWMVITNDGHPITKADHSCSLWSPIDAEVDKS